MPDIAYAASVHRRQELSSGRATAAFLPKFCSHPRQIWSVGVTGLVKWKRVSPIPEGCLVHVLGIQEQYLAGR